MPLPEKSKVAHSDIVPLSLGKPSLRRRLESYYSQVAPEQIRDKEEWKDRLDKIWEKFGGSVQGEQKLAAKLEKKYGSLVQLQIVVVDTKKQHPNPTPSQGAAKTEAQVKAEEAYYEPTEAQYGSRVVSFIDDCFDPIAVLSSTYDTVLESNPWLAECSILDRTEQCQSLLPQTDPLFKPAVQRSLKRPAESDTTSTKTKAPPAFAAIASSYKDGPLCILYEAMSRRKRVRVLVRYINGMRGTLTGHLLAFDKHFNLLLKDVEEVYSPRPVNEEEGKSNTEVEVERRLRAYKGDSLGEDWGCRIRRMAQIMVRGDNVVLVYKPEMERSCWPATRKSPKDTVYRKRSARKNVPPDQRVGTPGSLGLIGRGLPKRSSGSRES